VSHPESRISSAGNKPKELLCLNYDFDVRNSWDTPRLAATTTGTGCDLLTTSIPPRQSSSLAGSIHTLRKNTTGWINIRVSLAHALYACLSEERDDGTELDGHVKQFQAALEAGELTPVSTARESSPSPSLSLDEAMWKAVLLVLQAGQQLRVMKFAEDAGDGKKKVDETSAQTSAAARESAAGLADEVTTLLTETTQNLAQMLEISRSGGELLKFRSLGFVAMNQLNWLVLVVQWWDSQFSKWSKRKLEEADTTNSVTKLRVAVMGAASALEVISIDEAPP
jgi:hypothetical protein